MKKIARHSPPAKFHTGARMGDDGMLKRLMIGLIVGFYYAECIDSELAPALGTIVRYFRHLVCMLYALPVIDLAVISQGGPFH